MCISELIVLKYYAEHSYFSKNSRFAQTVSQLLPFAEYPQVLDGSCVRVPTIALTNAGFVASVVSLDRSIVITVNQDRLTQRL